MLTHWKLADQRLEFGHRFARSAELQQCTAPDLERRHSQLLQPGDLSAGPRFIGELRIGTTPPQLHRRSHPFNRSAEVVVLEATTGGRTLVVEALRVEFTGLDVEHVAGGGRLEAIGVRRAE